MINKLRHTANNIVTNLQALPAKMRNIDWKAFAGRVNNAFAGMVNFVKHPLQVARQWFSRAENDVKKLSDMREGFYQKIDAEQLKPNPDFVGLTKSIARDNKVFITKMIQEEIKKLGPAPTEMSVFTLGSLARQESGPVTDLEIGFLVKDKNVAVQKYCTDLSQNIADRLFMLGEHPAIGGKGLRLDEADNAPIHRKFFAKGLNPAELEALQKTAIANRDFDKIPFEGSRPFIATPEEFANFTREKFLINEMSPREREQKRSKAFHEGMKGIKPNTMAYEIKKEEVNSYVDQLYKPFNPREQKIAVEAGQRLGRNIAHLTGNKALFDQFYKQKERFLAEKDKSSITRRQKIVKNLMQEDVAKQLSDHKSIYATGKLGKTVDIKRQVYRFAEQFLTNLGFYHQVGVQNTPDIINKLVDKKVLTSEQGAKFSDYMNFAMGLRLKKQRTLKHQGFATYIDQEAFNEDKKDLEQDIENIKNKINYYESTKGNQDKIDQVKRELFKIEHKLEHLMEMAPGKILSQTDIELLNTKYLPIAKEMLEAAKEWSICPNRPEAPAPVAKKVKPMIVQPQKQAKPYTPGFMHHAAFHARRRVNHGWKPDQVDQRDHKWAKPKQ